MSCISSASARASGVKPIPFQLDNAGEWYYIGSEIGAYLRLFRGTLYKKYPGLWRRLVSPDERKRLIEQGIMRSTGNGGGEGGTTLPTNLTLVRASEVNEILSGVDDSRFRSSLQTFRTQINAYHHGPTAIIDDPTNYSKIMRRSNAYTTTNNNNNTSITTTTTNNVFQPNMNPAGFQTSNAAGIIPNNPAQQQPPHYFTPASQQLLETVPVQTPIPPRPASKKRAYPLCFDDMDPEAVRRNANLPEILVPVRLELDIEGQKLRDFLLWNKNETLIAPETFAEVTCEELDLNPASFVPAIAASIRRQVEAFPTENVHPPGYLVTIKLNIQIGNTSLVDKFDWDITNPDNSPEDFARTLAADLGLGNEFVCSIAFAIRSQLAYHRKNYNPAEPDDANGVPNINTILRRDGPFRTPQEAEEYCPKVETLSDLEMEKKLRDQDRNARRIRRTAGASGNPW